MTSDRLHINKLKDCFGDQEYFKTDDIAKFYRSLEPDLKQATVLESLFGFKRCP